MKANQEFISDNPNVENSIKVKFVRYMLVFSLFKAHLLFKQLVCQKCTSNTQCHCELEWNFCVGFLWEGLHVTHMVFAYHWTSQVSRTSEKIKKGQENFQRPYKGHRYISQKFYNFFALFGPFRHKNSADRSDLTLKAIKAKKAAIRPNLSNLDFRIFRGLAMVSQHAQRSYKVP